MTIAELCAAHPRLALDTNVLIYLLEGEGRLADVARGLIDGLEGGSATGSMATVALAELAAGPSRMAGLVKTERIVDEARSIDGLEWRPLTAEIAVDAGIIRGARGLPLPDAIHLASARAAGASALVTNDRRMRGSARLEVVYLDELELSEVNA